MTRWLTITQFAALVGIDRRTAQRWAREGRIRARRTRGGHWRISEVQVEAQPVTISEIAREIGVSERTVRDWAATGKLAARQPTPRGAWLVEPGEIERLKAVQNEGGRRA